MAPSNPFITEAFALLAVALTVIFLRTIARATSVGVRRFQLDDYMMLLAAVSFAFSHCFNAFPDSIYRLSTPLRLPQRTSWGLGGMALRTMA